jgi:hypothetical protein
LETNNLQFKTTKVEKSLTIEDQIYTFIHDIDNSITLIKYTSKFDIEDDNYFSAMIDETNNNISFYHIQGDNTDCVEHSFKNEDDILSFVKNDILSKE